MAQILVSVDDIVVGEKDGFAEFVVRLNAPSAASVSVNYFTSNGSAVASSDYIGINTNTLTFAPGEMVKTVRVPIVDDTAVEPTESFFFVLSSPTGGVIGNTYALATIIDNDAASGTPVMAISDPVVDEKIGEAHFTVTLDRPSTGVVSVNYATQAGTADAADFAAIAGILSFAPGETAKTVSVTIADDSVAEGNEQFDLVLSSPSGASLPDPVGTATIWASDQPTVSTPVISVADVVVGEGDGFAEFVVRLNAPSAASVSVNYFTSNGSAVANTDYIGISTNTLTFAPGEMVKTVQVAIVDDTAVEPTESFFFVLSSPTGGAVIGNTYALATIIDNDAASGTPVMAISDPVVDEKIGEARFTVTLDRPSTGVVSVNYATQAGTADAADFAAIAGILSFAPGETAKTVSVTIADDSVAEGNEQFDLVLSSPSGASRPDPVGTATIWASDQPTVSTPVISVADVVVGEGDGFAEFVVRLNAPSAASVSVNYFTSTGSAHANSDYIGISTNTLTFAPGEMVKTVRVPIVDDTTAEPTETFFFNLSSPTGGAVIGLSSPTGG